jgi:PIN like domain
MAEQTRKSKKPSDGNQEQLEPFVVFLDETSHKCAPIHRALESAETEFVQHGSKFRSGEFDEVWLPVVGNAGWAVLTCDKRIRYNQLEREKIIEHGIREFVFTSGNLNGAQMGEILKKALPSMRRVFHEYPAPFIATISKAGLVTVRFDKNGKVEPKGKKEDQTH